MSGLDTFSEYCKICTVPERIVCSDNAFVNHKSNYTEDAIVDKELKNACYKSKPNETLRCMYDKRQKFVSKQKDPNYCLSDFKEVFVYFYTGDQYTMYKQYPNKKDVVDNILNLSRVNEDSPLDKYSDFNDDLPKKDNLSAEPIDRDNYHIF